MDNPEIQATLDIRHRIMDNPETQATLDIRHRIMDNPEPQATLDIRHIIMDNPETQATLDIMVPLQFFFLEIVNLQYFTNSIYIETLTSFVP